MSKPSGASSAPPGVGSLIVGYFILGLQPVPVAILSRGGVSPSEAVFGRFVLSALFILVLALPRLHLLKTAQPGVLALRGLFGGAAVLLYFTSIQHSGAARGTLLNYTYPIWANVFAWFLGSRTDKRFWASLVLASVGVWFVVVPAEGLGSGAIGIGEISGLLSAVLGGAAIVTVKKLRETDDSLVIIASFTGFGLAMSLPLCSTSGLLLSVSDGLLLPTLAVGVTSFLGHYYFTRGYKGVTVATATLLSLLVPFFATVSGVLFLAEPLSGRFAFGSLFVFGSFLLSLRRKA